MNVAMLAALAVAASATPELNGQPEVKIGIHMMRSGSIPRAVEDHAKGIAHLMFEKAGIQVEWREGPAPRGASPLAFTVDLRADTPRTTAPGALAQARPYSDSWITVFYDRLGDVQSNRSLLAHVIVHEVTHMLQGGDFHSASGVMKARWSSSDQAEMGFRPLPFTQADIELIHKGIAWRISRANAAAKQKAARKP